MSQPGWYPDPGGQRGQLRFWDGQQWSQQTRPAAGGPVGFGPGGPGGPQQPYGAPQQRRRGGALIPVLLGLAALVVVIALVIGTQTFGPGPRDITDNPPSNTVSGFDDGSSPSPEPTPSDPTPSQAESPTPTETEQSETPGSTQIPCPRLEREDRGQYPADGRVHGGNLSFPSVGGEWERTTSRVAGVMTFGYDVDGESYSVTRSWFVQMTVGAVEQGQGFTDEKTTADAIVSCLATSGFMTGATGRADIHSKAITVSGKQGWTVRSEVRIPGRPDGIEGSVFDVVVVDSGVEGGYGFFVAESTIGHADELAVRDRTLAGLTIG